MANPYPANFETLEGGGRLTGQVNFTDPANQPGGGAAGGDWVGPFPFTAAEYNPALGSGWDGILVNLLGYSIPANALVLGTAVRIDVQWDQGSVIVYCGTLAGNDVQISRALNLNGQGADPEVLIVSLAGETTSILGAFNDGGVSQVWIDSFLGPPTVGSATLWLYVAQPLSP